MDAELAVRTRSDCSAHPTPGSRTAQPSPVAWLGVVSSAVGFLSSLLLWDQPALFIGVTDLALPLLLGIVGIVAARRGEGAARWLGVILGALAVLSCLAVFAALLVHEPFSGTGIEGG